MVDIGGKPEHISGDCFKDLDKPVGHPEPHPYEGYKGFPKPHLPTPLPLPLVVYMLESPTLPHSGGFVGLDYFPPVSLIVLFS